MAQDRVIEKYELRNDLRVATVVVMVTKRAIFRHAGEERGTLCVWIEVDQAAVNAGELEERTFSAYATGETLGLDTPGLDMEYLATVQKENGEVWHLMWDAKLL